MDINVKTKVPVSQELIDDLISKGWQEIENLQNQIAILDLDSNGALSLQQTLKNLLTSYYVFTGSLEGAELQTGQTEPDIKEYGQLETPEEPNLPVGVPEDDFAEVDLPNATVDFEPFEFFVDFDEPTGEPLTDKDLYNS